MGRTEERRRYAFFLTTPGPEAIAVARKHLEELGVKILNRQGEHAFTGLATADDVEQAQKTGLFSVVTSGPISKEHYERYPSESKEVFEFWNAMHSSGFKKAKADKTDLGKSWGTKDKSPPAPTALVDPNDFRDMILKKTGLDEKQFTKKYKPAKPISLEGKNFVTYEQKLFKIYKNRNLAYHMARTAYYLNDSYRNAVLLLKPEILELFQLLEPTCWRMEKEISVGVVFVESSRGDGPRFSSSERNTLRAEIADGLDWLAAEAPNAARLTWVYDWQFPRIDVANGSNTSSEDYWRNPAMGEVTYFGDTYSEDWAGVNEYREDMRRRNRSSHAIVIFVTPYGTRWHAYASRSRLTLADRNNWGGWGVSTIDRITAHEVCHLFGAGDEYTGSGTPCSGCGTQHGCDSMPNGNCGTCARPQQDCVMDDNHRRLCAYTKAHIGWADLFVELTTSDVQWAGTDDTVRLDIGDRTFNLDTANHNDREQNNVEGYAFCYTGISRGEIKRVGIRKSSDGFAGGWNLKRVRLWHQGDLICNANNINRWLEDEYRWWACTSCGSSNDIVNQLTVKVTTADVRWAGTDDTVRLYMGGRSWVLDNPWQNDFERGRTNTFNLDPGTGLYRSMLNSIRIHKSPDGAAGGWKLKGLQIYVNGTRIYSNQGINRWIEDNDRDWFGTIS